MTTKPDVQLHRNLNPSKDGRLSHRVYLVRVVFSLMTLVLILVNDVICSRQPAAHPFLLFAGLVYPHLGQFLLGRFDPGLRYGQALLLLDGLYSGAVIGALEFSWLPSLILIVICLFNWMIVGGTPLVGSGLVFLFLGAVLSGNLYTLLSEGPAGLCSATLWPSAALFAVYFLIVSQVIHRLIGALQREQAALQADTDAARAARSMAERALLSAFPRSVATHLESEGRYLPEMLQDADLLLIELSEFDAPPADLTVLQAVWQTCDTILARHGFELIKTFASRGFALGRGASSQEAALAAAREILTHFSDHDSQFAGGGGIPVRAVMHRGAVTLGLVQPARLNLDLSGPGIEELCAVSVRTASLAPRGLVLSPAAYRQLRDSEGFVPLPTATASPLGYWQHSPFSP